MLEDVDSIKYDEKVDVWAVGVVTHELLNLKTPLRFVDASSRRQRCRPKIPTKLCVRIDGASPEELFTPGVNWLSHQVLPYATPSSGLYQPRAFISAADLQFTRSTAVSPKEHRIVQDL